MIMSKTLLEQYTVACDFRNPLDESVIAAEIAVHYAALGCTLPPIHRVDSFGAAGAAGAARAAGAAWDAWDAWAAWAAGAAGSAWAARAAWAAGPAWAARAARAAWDASLIAPFYIGAMETDRQITQQVLGPIFRALRAGLWLYWYFDDRFIWIPQPRVFRNDRHQLHRAEGPAFILPNESLYFWRGVYVTEQIIKSPETLMPDQIMGEHNAQVRQVMVERVGIERVLQMCQAKELDRKTIRIGEQDHPYVLLECTIGNVRGRWLKMVNPSIGVYHVEGLPGRPATVEEALHERKPDWMKQIPVDANGLDYYQQGDVLIVPKGAKSLKRYPTTLT